MNYNIIVNCIIYVLQLFMLILYNNKKQELIYIIKTNEFDK